MSQKIKGGDDNAINIIEREVGSKESIPFQPRRARYAPLNTIQKVVIVTATKNSINRKVDLVFIKDLSYYSAGSQQTETMETLLYKYTIAAKVSN